MVAKGVMVMIMVFTAQSLLAIGFVHIDSYGYMAELY